MTQIFSEEQRQQIAQLVVQARGGDNAAIGQLYEMIRPYIVATLRARVRNQEDVEELTQDVFLQSIRKLEQLQDATMYVAWIRTIAARMAINHGMKFGREKLLDNEVLEPQTVSAEDPIDTALAAERKRFVKNALRRLAKSDRETLRAYYFHGESVKAMAKAFRVPIGTIKRRLFDARQRLAEKLNPELAV